MKESEDMNRPVVIGLGEVLWDVFPDGKRPGGAPANFAFQANQLGCNGVVVSRVGRDELGTELVDFLTSKGLRTSAIQLDDEFPTGKVTVSFNEKNQPEYVIHEDVAWDRLEFNDKLKSVVEMADAICFGSLAQRTETSRKAIQQAVASTSYECLRVFDVNIRQDYYDLETIENSLKLANVLKLNDEEVHLLAPKMNRPTDEREFSQSLVDDKIVDVVCVTRGSKGCLLTDDSQVVEVKGSPVEVADTVGAGDAFTAGLTFSLLSKRSLKECGEFANRIGGLVASHQGAMPELRDEFAKLIVQ